MTASDRPHDAYRRIAVDAARTLTEPPLLVGHSGAGAFLPAIAAAIGGSTALLFVDAVIPPTHGPHRTPDEMKELLDGQSVDGLLRRWLDWWPADVIERLLPDPADREELAADMPRVPRSFYDADVDVPPGWSDGSDARCAYLRLSSAYDAELHEAERREWPTAALASTHLGTHTEPGRTLHALLELTDRIDRA